MSFRACGITDPFVHSLDSAFQESLALSHLKYGLFVTKALATTAVFEGRAVYHAAHPPLLQLIYAGLYSILGVHEWVSRLVSMIAVLGVMICLWTALMKAGARRAVFPAMLAFALMPLSVRLGRTTNYEPISLAILSVILLGYLYRERRWGVPLMCVSAVVGGLFEWTTYLAFPALAVTALVSERNLRSLKPLVIPSLLAGATLAALFGYQHQALGHVPVLTHASVRSDPSVIFNLAAWSSALSRIWMDVGVGLLISIWGLLRFNGLRRDFPGLGIVVGYFALVPFLFFVLAPQLVLVHPIAQYYLVPLVAIAIGITIEGGRRLWVWLLLFVVLVTFVVKDVKVLKEQSRLHYDLARLLTQDESEKNFYAFDSSAVGYLRYYHGVETMYPLGGSEPPLEKIVSNEKVRYVILDKMNPEVEYVRESVKGVDDLYIEWRFAQTEVYKRGKPADFLRLTNELDRAEMPELTENLWEIPAARMMEVDGRVLFGIFHHPREKGGSTIIFRGVRTGARFEITARLDPNVCDSTLTDGVAYSATIGNAEWFKHFDGIIQPVAKSCLSNRLKVDLSDAPPEVDIMFTTTPLGNSAFDRFFWEDPRMVYEEE